MRRRSIDYFRFLFLSLCVLPTLLVVVSTSLLLSFFLQFPFYIPPDATGIPNGLAEETLV